MAKGTFQKDSDGETLIAKMPAGATWDWTRDLADQLALDADTITSAVWALDAAATAAGLSLGATVTTATKASVFVVAPPVPSDEPFRVTLTYATAGGRTTPLAFLLYVLDPLLFS